jgi:hypothetical protein
MKILNMMHGSCVFYILIGNDITDFLREIIVTFANSFGIKLWEIMGFQQAFAKFV